MSSLNPTEGTKWLMCIPYFWVYAMQCFNLYSKSLLDGMNCGGSCHVRFSSCISLIPVAL